MSLSMIYDCETRLNDPSRCTTSWCMIVSVVPSSSPQINLTLHIRIRTMRPHCITSPCSHSEDMRCRWWTLIDSQRCQSCICNGWTIHWMKQFSWPPSNGSRSKWWELKYSKSMILLQCRQTLEDRRIACSSSFRSYALAAGNESTSGNPSLSYCPYYLSYHLSYPSLDICHLYKLYCHYQHLSTHLCKEQSFWREPILSLECSFHFDGLGDDLIWRGSHRGVFVLHQPQEDFPLVIPWDPTKEVGDVFLLSNLGDWLCRVRIGISFSGRWHSAEIVILDFPIDPRCIVVDISAVLLVDPPKVSPNLEDVELQLWLVGYW